MRLPSKSKTKSTSKKPAGVHAKLVENDNKVLCTLLANRLRNLQRERTFSDKEVRALLEDLKKALNKATDIPVGRDLNTSIDTAIDAINTLSLKKEEEHKIYDVITQHSKQLRITHSFKKSLENTRYKMIVEGIAESKYRAKVDDALLQDFIYQHGIDLAGKAWTDLSEKEKWKKISDYFTSMQDTNFVYPIGRGEIEPELLSLCAVKNASHCARKLFGISGALNYAVYTNKFSSSLMQLMNTEKSNNLIYEKDEHAFRTNLARLWSPLYISVIKDSHLNIDSGALMDTLSLVSSMGLMNSDQAADATCIDVISNIFELMADEQSQLLQKKVVGSSIPLGLYMIRNVLTAVGQQQHASNVDLFRKVLNKSTGPGLKAAIQAIGDGLRQGHRVTLSQALRYNKTPEAMPPKYRRLEVQDFRDRVQYAKQTLCNNWRYVESLCRNIDRLKQYKELIENWDYGRDETYDFGDYIENLPPFNQYLQSPEERTLVEQMLSPGKTSKDNEKDISLLLHAIIQDHENELAKVAEALPTQPAYGAVPEGVEEEPIAYMKHLFEINLAEITQLDQQKKKGTD